MAVNLVEQFGRHRSRELLETSFAQFQADKSVVGISRQVQRNEEGLEGYKESMTCHLGDFDEYARLRRELKDRETELARQGRRSGAPRRPSRWRSSSRVTSSMCPPASSPGWRWCWTPGCPPGGPTATGASSSTTGRARWC